MGFVQTPISSVGTGSRPCVPRQQQHARPVRIRQQVGRLAYDPHRQLAAAQLHHDICQQTFRKLPLSSLAFNQRKSDYTRAALLLGAEPLSVTFTFRLYGDLETPSPLTERSGEALICPGVAERTMDAILRAELAAKSRKNSFLASSDARRYQV